MTETSDTLEDGPHAPKAALPPSTAPEVALGYGNPNPGPTKPRASLGQLTVHGSLLTVGTYFLLNVIRLGSNLILTRLLVPEMFGTMLIVNTVMVGIRLFSDVGIGPSLISNPRGVEERFLRTAFTIQAVRGVLIWLVACALAYPISRVYGNTHEMHDILVKLLPIAGLSAVIEGFRSTGIFRIQRDLRFGPLSLIELIEMSLAAIGMVLFALLISANHWALVVPPLMASAVGAILTHTILYHDRRDRFGFDWEVAREMTRVGRWIFVSTLITFFASQFDRLILGKLVAASVLGVYGIALNLAVMPINGILKIGSSVLFPTFARVVSDPDRFLNVFTRARTMLLTAGAAVVCGMLAAGPYVIAALYRSEYEAAGWMLQLLALGCWFQIVDASNTAALLSHQRPAWIAGSNLVKVLGMVILVPIAFHLPIFKDRPNAPMAMAFVAIAIADAGRAIFSTYAMGRALHGGPRLILPDIAFPVAIAAVAFVAIKLAALAEPAVIQLVGGDTDRLHRFLFNSTMASLTLAIVMVVWLPLCVRQWRRSRRGAAATATAVPTAPPVA